MKFLWVWLISLCFSMPINMAYIKQFFSRLRFTAAGKCNDPDASQIPLKENVGRMKIGTVRRVLAAVSGIALGLTIHMIVESREKSNNEDDVANKTATA